LAEERSDINRLVWPEDDNRALSWLDRVGKLKEAAVTGGVAYLGYKTFNHWTGALYGLLALRLADNAGGAGVAPNLSQFTGISMLALLGATQMRNVTTLGGQPLPPTQQVRDVDTGQMITYELQHTDAGWSYVRAGDEPPPVQRAWEAETQPYGAQVGEWAGMQPNPYL